MADLISRAALIARIDKCVALSGIGLEPVMAIRDVKALISVLPAVDAISVEWLRKHQSMTPNMSRAMGIDILLEIWQKEQEAR